MGERFVTRFENTNNEDIQVALATAITIREITNISKLWIFIVNLWINLEILGINIYKIKL
jgi:hypothetical protein